MRHVFVFSNVISFVWVLTNFHLYLGSLLRSVDYFFLPKKLKRFSRSLSLPSLLRMVTPPALPELGDIGGMVIARLRPRVPLGERSEDNKDDWIVRIHELISAWRREWIHHNMNITLLLKLNIREWPRNILSKTYLILCLEQVLFSIPKPLIK